jgi:choline-sulfatase
MTDAPNLLFLMSDQHSPRITGCYGDPVVRTPNIDRLAAGGVTFDNAYSPSPLCVPARMSLLTGRHPSYQDCWTNSDPLASDLPTTAHALGAAGRRPILVGRLHAIGPDQLHGFAERQVGDHSTNWVGGYGHSMGVLDKTNGPFRASLEKSGPGRSSYEVHDHDVVASTLEVLDRLAAERDDGAPPFSLNVGFMLPHQPYVADPEIYRAYEGRVGLPEVPRPAATDDHPYLLWWRQMTGIEAVGEDEVLRARIAYYALVETFDRMVGRVLDRLEALGLADNTLIVYTSDHGDQIGERGLWWKQTFYDDSIKVPLILSWPGALPDGERRGQIVNLIDLAPTILEAAGAPALPGADGRSFLAVARDGTAPWDDETFAEYCTDGMAPWAQGLAVQQRMVRAGPWKLVYYHGQRPQLFDLASDPQESRDLAEDPKYAAIRDDLTAKVLVAWDPDDIARRMAEHRRRKELLSAWSRRVEPPDSYRWTLKMEDNWLAEE